jgi:hypothetical protein
MDPLYLEQERRHLAQANRHIAEARAHIVRQRLIVGKLAMRASRGAALSQHVVA